MGGDVSLLLSPRTDVLRWKI